MSATGRGETREELDGYWTPIACATAICERLRGDKLIAPRGAVLEPSIGKGAFAAAIQNVLEPELLVGVDLVEQEGVKVLDAKFVRGDFLQFEPDEYFDAVIGNPPYADAEEHVRHALTLLDPERGVLAFLLRLNFLEGKDRVSGLWKEHPPSVIYVLNRRPSFKKTKKPKVDKKTGEIVTNKRTGKPRMVSTSNDSCAYGVFCWVTPQRQVSPLLRWLEW